MDQHGFPSVPQRGPRGLVPPISIPLAPLRPPASSVSLTEPRPETDRRDNEYVETPLRSGLVHPSQGPAPLPPRSPAPPPPTPVPAVVKQPLSYSKATAATLPSSDCADVHPSIMCADCGRCRCATCQAPRPLPQAWACNNTCLLSGDSVVDYASCLCCVKALFYHCSEADDVENNCVEDPCSCGPEQRTMRWGCLAALACALPCLCFYWPLRAARRGAELCYSRYSRQGCQCRLPKETVRPPSKRLLTNDTMQDF